MRRFGEFRASATRGAGDRKTPGNCATYQEARSTIMEVRSGDLVGEAPGAGRDATRRRRLARGGWTLKLRLAVVLTLAALSVTYRGMGFYMRYFSPDLRTRSTFVGEYRKGAITVTKTDEACPRPKERQADCTDHAHPGDRIVEVYDGKGRGGAATGLFSYGAYLRPIGSKESWTMVVDRPLESGGSRRLSLHMAPAVPIQRTFHEWVTNLGFDVYLPLLALMAGLFIGLLRPENRQAFQAALAFLGFSLVFGQDVSQLSPGWREAALVLRVTATVFAPFLILKFFLEFPRRSALVRRAPWLVPACFAVSCVAWVFGMTFQSLMAYSFDAYERFAGGLGGSGTRIVGTAAAAGMIVVALVALALNTARAESRDDRRRLILILIGALAGLLPVLVLYLWPKKVPAAVLLVSLPLMGLFPITFVMAVVRHRIFGIRLVLRRGLQYALLSRGFLAIEGFAIFMALYFAVGPLLVRYVPDSAQSVASVGIAAVALGLVFGTQRVNRRIMPIIDRRFFRDAYDAQRILTDLAKAVRHLASRPDLLLQKVTDEISAALHPDHVAVFLREEPWPRLSPIREDAPVRFEAGESGKEGGERFALHVYRRSTVPRPAGAWQERLAPETVLFARRSVAHVLDASVHGEAEILDVFAASGPAASADGRAAGAAGCLDDAELFLRFDARIVVPLATQGRALGFLVLGQKRSEEHYTSQDHQLLLGVAEQISIALDYSRMIERVAGQQKLEREIQIAQDVQERLFPQDRPVLSTLRCAGTCRTARGVGGDYFDFLRLGPDLLGLVVADIAGKGLSAALLMASLQALVRSHAAAQADDLGAFAGEINRHLCESTDDARFATLFLGMYHDGTRRLRYVNAGHNPPILLRSGGRARLLRLVPSDTILGCFPERRWSEQEVGLEPGDLLVIFSDGIVEATNAADEQFGDDRLVDLVERNAGLDEEALMAAIVGEVGRFLGPVPPQDDMTLIVARIS
jgi:sigma-B regulation protein RsbU (phosphoserine phosphatase)